MDENSEPQNLTGTARVAEDLALSVEDASTILRDAGVSSSGLPDVKLLKRWNHVWRLSLHDGRAYYVKSHTKDWYAGNPVVAAGRAADQEQDAYMTLEMANISTPALVRASLDAHNPLGRPYLLVSELPGTSFVDADRGAFSDATRAVGRYMAQMHAIKFDSSGYMGSFHRTHGTGGYRHPNWAFDPFMAEAERTWSQDEETVDGTVLHDAAAFVRAHEDALRASFDPPRFTHNDCHAHQFFVVQAAGASTVSGVIDMEVSSRANPLADFLKLGLEMAGRYKASITWWLDLFDGYGSQPSFDLLRAFHLAAHDINYTCLGKYSWPGGRERILQHILSARDWNELYDLDRLRS